MSDPDREDGSTEPPPIGFARFRQRATELVQDREALRELGRRAVERAGARSPALGSALADLQTLIRLVQAWVRADYRDVSRSSLVLVVAAILYFVAPLDLIPDFLVGVGLIDDVAVIGWVARRLREELDAFRKWEHRNDAMETMVGRTQVPTEDPDASPKG